MAAAEQLYENAPGLTEVQRAHLGRCARALAAYPCVALCVPESVELRWHPAKRGYTSELVRARIVRFVKGSIEHKGIIYTLCYGALLEKLPRFKGMALGVNKVETPEPFYYPFDPATNFGVQEGYLHLGEFEHGVPYAGKAVLEAMERVLREHPEVAGE